MDCGNNSYLVWLDFLFQYKIENPSMTMHNAYTHWPVDHWYIELWIYFELLFDSWPVDECENGNWKSCLPNIIIEIGHNGNRDNI